MENFDDINSIWHSVKVRQLPDANEFVTIVNKYKSRRRKISNGLLGILFLCVAGFVAVWFGYQTTMWTTRVGEVLIFVAVFYAIYYSYRDLQKKKNEDSMAITLFLSHLKKEVTEKKEEKRRVLTFLSLMSVAYGFFIYENASASLQSIIVSYTVLTFVICFFWFIYRPFVNRVQQKSVKETVSKIEELQKQIN
jgi:hypothetical protein